MPKHIFILRWIAVLPAALLFAALSTFPVHWAVMVIQYFGRADDTAGIVIDGKKPLAAIPPDVLERFGYAFFTPFVLISAAAWIAPRFKFSTGIGLAILWGIVFGCAVTYINIMSRGQPSGWQWLRFALTCLLAVAGVVSGLFRAHKFEKEFCDTQAVS